MAVATVTWFLFGHERDDWDELPPRFFFTLPGLVALWREGLPINRRYF